MTVQTLKLAGKRFVIVEERDFRRLERRAEMADEGALPSLPKPLADGNYPAPDAMRINLARRLIRDRRAVGLTQAELARRAGMAPESLNRIEKGKLTPTMTTLQKIDRALAQAEQAEP
ncbi:MAG TPA: helix-turn-helix transcriptional regulator [Tepidisphaeraceae bacterium]|nr:helix-turn-helix transcriptional regulator [Tepidisphaeraceae bacterium]